MSHSESVYKILDDAARAWWHHRQLREQGKHEEARALERGTILGRVLTLRQCLENKGFAMVGRGGITVYFRKHGRLEIRSSDVNNPIVQCCIRLGIPVCDSTTILDDQIVEVVGFPTAVINPDPEPENGYNSSSFAPVEHVFRLYRELGATVYNLEVRDMDITMRVVITKNRYRGWSCITYVQYPDWPNEAITSTGYSTLKSALWSIVLRCMDLGAKLTTVHVKGKLMPNAEIWRRVRQVLAGGCLSYELPAIKEYLEVTNE